MNANEIEKQLLEKYRQAAIQALDSWDGIASGIEQKITLYENQVMNCKKRVENFDARQDESQVFYLKARQLIQKEELVITPTGALFNLFFGAITGKYERQYRTAKELLDRAITLWDMPQYRLERAKVNKILGDKKGVLVDINHLLTHYQNEQSIYFAARELQDQLNA